MKENKEPDNMVSERLTALMAAYDLKQEQLENLSGVSQGAISKWLLGGIPKLLPLDQVAKVFWLRHFEILNPDLDVVRLALERGASPRKVKRNP